MHLDTKINYALLDHVCNYLKLKTGTTWEKVDESRIRSKSPSLPYDISFTSEMKLIDIANAVCYTYPGNLYKVGNIEREFPVATKLYFSEIDKLFIGFTNKIFTENLSNVTATPLLHFLISLSLTNSKLEKHLDLFDVIQSKINKHKQFYVNMVGTQIHINSDNTNVTINLENGKFVLRWNYTSHSKGVTTSNLNSSEDLLKLIKDLSQQALTTIKSSLEVESIEVYIILSLLSTISTL